MADLFPSRASKTTATFPSPAPSETLSSKSGFLVEKLQKYTGFTKTYNIVLFSLTAVSFSAFCIFRFPSLNIEVWGMDSTPGDWFWFREGIYRIGIIMHLWCVLPAGALMPLQFLPIIRRKYLAFHRTNGRVVLILLLTGNIGALMISDRAAGGTIALQYAVICLAISTTGSAVKGYFAIRDLRLDQHRSWMLRTWAYASVILTMRVLLFPMALSAKLSSRSYHTVSTCQEIIFMYQKYSIPLDNIYAKYATCRNFTESVPAYVVVKADANFDHPEEIASILELCFGPCTWVASVIHIFAIEWYLRATAGEDERLRKVSMVRREAVGLA